MQFNARVCNRFYIETDCFRFRISEELLTGQLGLYQHIGPDQASNISHRLHNLVLSCYVHFIDGVMERKIPCSHSSVKIEKFMHKEYFNCYRFYGEKESGFRASLGMSFLLYIYDIRDKHSVNLNGNGGKGGILTIVERESFLNPYTKGVEILPNVVNRIKFSRTNRIRIPHPWGNCLNRDDLRNRMTSRFTSGLSSPYLYTEDSCVSTCIEYNIIQTCGCQDVGQYGILLDVFTNVSMCGATNQGKDALLERMKCAQQWRSTFRSKCIPKCPPPCQEETYKRHVTYLEISPSEIEQMLNRERVQSTVPKLIPGFDNSDNDNTADNHITRNDGTTEQQDGSNTLEGSNTNDITILDHVSKLNVSSMCLIQLRRESNSYFIVEDIKAMTVSDWLAKIGGTLNLWSGITVFVLVELLDLVIRLVTTAFKVEQQAERRNNVYEHN